LCLRIIVLHSLIREEVTSSVSSSNAEGRRKADLTEITGDSEGTDYGSI
jgi:hypothetical protein